MVETITARKYHDLNQVGEVGVRLISQICDVKGQKKLGDVVEHPDRTRQVFELCAKGCSECDSPSTGSPRCER